MVMGRSLVGRIARRAGARPSALTRREFLLASLATGTSLMLADRRGSAIARSAVPRVVIIGAGFGGLSCAFQLKRAGVRVFTPFTPCCQAKKWRRERS